MRTWILLEMHSPVPCMTRSCLSVFNSEHEGGPGFPGSSLTALKQATCPHRHDNWINAWMIKSFKGSQNGKRGRIEGDSQDCV